VLGAKNPISTGFKIKLAVDIHTKPSWLATDYELDIAFIFQSKKSTNNKISCISIL